MYELIVFSSDVESLRKGIIKTSKNEAQAPYTILLVGETSVGKTSVLGLIANVLTGNGLDNYDPDILNEQGGTSKQRQTNSAHLYEFTSKNGVMVGPGTFEHAEMCDPVPRSGSSIPLGWPTNTGGFSKMSSTRGVL